MIFLLPLGSSSFRAASPFVFCPSLWSLFLSVASLCVRLCSFVCLFDRLFVSLSLFCVHAFGVPDNNVQEKKTFPTSFQPSKGTIPNKAPRASSSHITTPRRRKPSLQASNPSRVPSPTKPQQPPAAERKAATAKLSRHQNGAARRNLAGSLVAPYFSNVASESFWEAPGKLPGSFGNLRAAAGKPLGSFWELLEASGKRLGSFWKAAGKLR